MKKKLIERQNAIIVRAKEIVVAAEKEGRQLTETEAKEMMDGKKEIDSIKTQLDAIRAFDGLDETEPDRETDPVQGKGKTEKAEKTPQEVQEERAFENYIRGRIVNERAGELTKADNGAVIPASIAKRIIEQVYDICPVLEKSSKYNVEGTLQLPYYDDKTSSITVAYATEFAALTSTSGSYKTITLTGFLAGALTKVALSLVNNSQFDVVSLVIKHMAMAIARWIEHELLLGTANKVEGLSTLQNKVTTAATAAVTADELINLQDLVKDVFQKDAIWIMSPKTRNAIRKLKDGENRYLLNIDVTSPFGHTLLGKPVYVSDQMPDLGAGRTAIYYGDFSGLATKFSEQINIQVLREKYADEHAVGVVGWVELDSKIQDSQKLAKLVCKAS